MKTFQLDTATPTHVALVALKFYLEKANMKAIAVSQANLDKYSELGIIHEFDTDCGIHAIGFLDSGEDVEKKKAVVHDLITNLKIQLQKPPTGTLQ
jgi:hypothetical protein